MNEIVYEATIGKIWLVQIWANGQAKLYHDPRRGLSGQYVIYRADDGKIKFSYRWGQLPSRQIPGFVQKAAAKAYEAALDVIATSKAKKKKAA